MEEFVKTVVIPVGMLILGALIAHLARARTKKEQADEKLIDRVIELESQLLLLRQQVVPISTAFQAILIKELTHIHEPVVDELLAKIGPPYILNPEEEEQLLSALADRVNSTSAMMTESERGAAAMLPMVIKRVRAELALNVGDLQHAAASSKAE